MNEDVAAIMLTVPNTLGYLKKISKKSVKLFIQRGDLFILMEQI